MTHRFLPLLCVACLAWAGCSATAPPTRTAADFDPAQLDRVAVVFARGEIGTKNFTTFRPDTAAAVTAEAIVPRLMEDYARHFGVSLVDARETVADSARHAAALEAFAAAVQAVRDENAAVGDLPYAEGRRAGRSPLESAVAGEVVALAEATDCRHLLSIAVMGWEASAGEKFLDALLLVGGGINTGPNQATVIETALVDVDRGEVAWYSTRGAVLNPRDPQHLAALVQTVALELFGGRYIAPFSFSPPLDHDAVVYLTDGGRVTGHVRGPEDLHFIVETREGTRRVPVETVKSVRSFTDTGKLFPRTK